MSRRTSTRAKFDGAVELALAWSAGLRPEPSLTVSQWADRHRILSPRASAEPGLYRTSRTPYMRDIMDALSATHPARRVVLCKAAQIGATEVGVNWIGYVIHHAPGPMMMVQPTVELAKRASRQRVDPLIEHSPVLRALVKPARARDSGNTVLGKEFPGGYLIMTGANSAVGLRSMPARYLFLDEVDAYPPSAGEEGDPVALAEARTRTFAWRSKVFLASTPTIQGVSRIEREYEASDQRRYFVPCPHCGEMQWLKFERLQWEKGAPNTVHYVCEHCERRIDEHHKGQMLAAGEWRATAVSDDPGTIGFHISGLYSPPGWLSWEAIARSWEAAITDEARRSAKNTILGETWTESGDAPEWQRLYERRESWSIGTVPNGAVVLTAGADVQRDRIEVSVWGWGRGLSSWLVDHIVILGGPERAETWAELDALLLKTWPHESGVQMSITIIGIDTGFDTAAVYGWARSRRDVRVAPLKGVRGYDRAGPVSGPRYIDTTSGGRKIHRGVRLWTVSVSVFKAELYRFLRLDRPTDEEIAAGAEYPPGYVHLPAGMDAELVQQLVAEQLVTVRDRRGFQHLEWQKLRERNEVLDCRVYARAAAWILGVDRWREAQWVERESHFLAAAASKSAADVDPPPPPPAPPSPPKRESGWLGRRGGWL